MDINYLLIGIFVPLICFLIGLYIFLKNPLKNFNFMFFIFTWFITIWAMLSYAFFLDQTNELLYKIAFSLGGVCILTTIPWVLFLLNTDNKFLIRLPYIFSALLVSVPFWDKWAMYNYVSDNNTYSYDTGISYYFYVGIVLCAIVYLFYILIKNLFVNDTNKKRIVLFVLIGYTIYISGEMYFGLILPVINYTSSIPYDNVGALIFVVASAVGLMKYDKNLLTDSTII